MYARLYYNICMRAKAKPVFKDYNNNQLMLLPPNLDDLIDANHPVRTVNRIVDEINMKPLLDEYKGGGTSSYNPRMLLKVLIYAYLCNIFSSRKMESALKENIHFMWLSGMNTPDHNTINRFRSDRLKESIKKIFSQVVVMLADSGYLSLKEVYIDGTKIEANANRYTFVWGKCAKTNKDKIVQQLQELWDHAQTLASEELKDQTDTNFSEMDPSKIDETVRKIDAELKKKTFLKI